MRRLVAILLSAGLLGLIPVATASAAACPRLTGYAVLEVDTSTNSGVGVATVVYDDVVEVVDFTSSAIIGSDPLQVIQVWSFDAGDVTLHEYAKPKPIGDQYLTINSAVEVDAGGTGSLRFQGLYNLSTDTATYVVRGRLCITP